MPRAARKTCLGETERQCHSIIREGAPKCGKCHWSARTLEHEGKEKTQYTWQPPVRKLTSSFIPFTMEGLYEV